MTIRRRLQTLRTGIDERGVNVRILRQVERTIRKHPEQYDQGLWFATKEDRKNGVTEVTPEHVQENLIPGNGPVCGTTCCVAGHILVRSRRFKEFTSTSTRWDRMNDRYVDRIIVSWSVGAEAVSGLDSDISEWLFATDRVEEVMPDILRAIRKGTVELDAHALRRLKLDLLSADEVENGYMDKEETADADA